MMLAVQDMVRPHGKPWEVGGTETTYPLRTQRRGNSLVYESDFGDLEVVVNRFQRSRSCLVLQTDMWAMAVLRPYKLVDLAKDGDSERKQLIIEYCLEARNEAASAGVFDLTTS